MSHRLRISVRELMTYLQNYNTSRLGHISRGMIEHLVKESILPPLEFSDFEQCIDCIKGKYVKQIKKNAKRSAGILEIIHMNICGLLFIAYVDGYDSFIIFTDDYSRYEYIYPIKERSEDLDKFKIFKTEVENQHDIKIKIVRSDRGGGSTTVVIPHMVKFLDLSRGLYRKMA
jgi:hypothetical protein